MFQNQNGGLPDEHVEIAVEMGKVWTRFVSGRGIRPWEEFGGKERFRRFGGGKGKEKVVGVERDESREYRWLEWLDGHEEVARDLFVVVMEMVECKLLRQGQESAGATETARI